MGDRALIIFTNKKGEVSPTVYLHWNGSKTPDLINECKEFMQGRHGDVSYTCARFIGLVHESMRDTNLSLGVWNTDTYIQGAIKNFMIATYRPDQFSNPDIVKKEAMYNLNAESHGDAGLFVVNVDDFSWHCFGSYCAESKGV